MKRGLIIYNNKDAEKNKWLIEQCLTSFAESGISLSFLLEEEALDFIKHQPVDFAIYRGRDYKISEALEKKGTRVFNSSLTNKTANDKYLSYLFLKEKELPCVETYLKAKELAFPYVMKSVDGHGGKEVFLINSKKEESNILQEYRHKKFVYQEFIKNDGDARLYILNNQFVTAIIRHNPNDFRSNYTLGGDVAVFKPNQALIDIAIKISRLLAADYIGIDFIKVGDKYFVNEIEDPVGSRMVYKLTDIDIVELFIEHIKKSLNE